MRCLIISFLTIFIFVSSNAQQTAEKYTRETRYLLSLPEQYDADTAKRWPLVLFLHGSGEAGTDVQKVKVNGPPKQAGEGRKFPFILVSPQAEPHEGWDHSMLYKLLQHIKAKYRVNNAKVYVTGLSMGGYGTWELAMKYPEEFAAIAPVCGGGDSSRAWRLRHIPIWNFHGAKDDAVFPIESEKMVTAARRYNSNVKYTLYPEANHNSWDSAYKGDMLYNWLLEQSKFEYTPVKVRHEQLTKYEGTYVNVDNKDTVRLIAREAGFNALQGRDTIPLNAAAGQVFFIPARINMDIHFITDNKNKVTGFEFRGNDRVFFRRVK